MQLKKRNIIFGVSGYLIILALVIAALFLVILKDMSRQSSQKNILTKKIETTEAFGIKLENKCYKELQNFISSYGEDYSKCQSEFIFTEQYCGGYDPETQGLSDTNIIVILDSSGSMSETISGETKIDSAKKTISNFLSQMPTGVNTGLVVYGHKGSNSIYDKNLSCQGVEEIIKLGANNSSKITSTISSFGPQGWTPIAGSINFAKNIFASKGVNNKNYLILVSDGIESCDGDPLITAENLRLAVPGVKLIVVGFSSDYKTRQFLAEVASWGNGSFYNGVNKVEIAKIFNDQLLIIKGDCLKMTFLKMSWRYQAYNSDNLSCWLKTYQKESDAFAKKEQDKTISPECAQQVSETLKGRHSEFWKQKEELEEKNIQTYKKLEKDYNTQMSELEKSK